MRRPSRFAHIRAKRARTSVGCTEGAETGEPLVAPAHHLPTHVPGIRPRIGQERSVPFGAYLQAARP